MLPWKGRLPFKQYMMAKPTKWGIKAWLFCEACSGYVLRFNIYLGKEDQAPEGVAVWLCQRVVEELVADLHDSHVHVYVDNFYTYIALFR